VFLLILALETPALLALLDCTNRNPDDFAGGAEDRRSWLKWLVVGVATAWFLVGNGIVLGYYYAVIRRNTPMRPG
jgi:hypothetical protein